MATKIYTKTGDKGETALFGGKRLPKHHIRIEAYGTIDELNAFIGLLRDCIDEATLSQYLKNIQDKLFSIGSVLACDPEKDFGLKSVDESDISDLEKAIDAIDAVVPPLKNFILPGGHTTVSFCHIARCVCRRAERQVVALNTTAAVPEIIIRYLNRLSDYLFILARKLTIDTGSQEIIWKG